MPGMKVKKTDDFNEWYNEIVELADLCDKRYPIKGMNVWRPYGWQLISHIDQLIRNEMNRTKHNEVSFPLLIPESSFKKEEEHIEGFGSEVFWVTHAGQNELEERWLLRPTSETAMYPLFSLWVRSHADLPLKTFQIVNTFRYETKQTRAFIRVREIHFFEAHTCHRDFSDAERQIQEDLGIAETFFKKLCLPYVLNIRPEWDKFAGAHYTISIDVLMPSGRTLQLGSIHQYKDNFSRAYDITYEDEEGEHQYCHQTTYGMSERIVGALVGIHSDNNGLILPPAVAPIQIVLVPIVFKEEKKDVLKECDHVADELQKEGWRVHIDKRDESPGSKYYDWELKGVPLRIEIGPKELEENKVLLVRRDTGEKNLVKKEKLHDSIQEVLNSIKKKMYSDAEKELEDKIIRCDSIDKAKKEKGIIELPWCADEDCAVEIEEQLGVKTLGKPLEKEKCDARCPVCGNEAETWVRFAKTY